MGIKAELFEDRTKTVPDWRRNPATVIPPAGIDDFIARSNAYFEECAEYDNRPTLTGYALAVGLPGPTSLIRLGQRLPQLRYVISRCMVAIASFYEEMLGMVNPTGPMFMLKNIPDFDPDENVGAPPVQFFNDRKEIVLQANITGAARANAEFDEEDPLDAYIRLIRKRGYIPGGEEIASEVIRAKSEYIPPRKALTILTEGWEDE
jgi:hypothetical protein